ncbi:MAG: hypothetical protein Ct9H300mP16_09080 [Pseudomonadota bacterium]|nr:MAG: hypothetical protein Ct9H300mP16_09080 [Pseudomonadota bacterium]
MKLADLANLIGGICRGDGTLEIEALATLEGAGAGDHVYRKCETRAALGALPCRGGILREKDLRPGRALQSSVMIHSGLWARGAGLRHNPVPEPGVTPRQSSQQRVLPDSVPSGGGD